MKKHLWKSLLMMWILSTSCISNADEKFKCGEYEFKGVIKQVDGNSVLKLYEGSMSETVFSLAPDLAEVASVYKDSAVTLKGKLFEPAKNYRGKIESTKTAEEIKELTSEDKPYTARFMRDDIKERVPDPLHPDMDSGMKLVKAESCDRKAEKSSSKKPKKK
ncbi:hypothetical protein AZI85_12220 [Bdellovibrio bacteriovorus]|uniref:Lipoprotein n=1 Tax=Bdellovibrio bacteriovorus TaxID=959 RepID=A0A150WCV7_BDEBC|nr:hypothetical protein [Bdellovibrio bacteriovorus]KYG60749.1 hypothetical protein AZI85_12220 [Bdellovibrio bacteriovorus]